MLKRITIALIGLGFFSNVQAQENLADRMKEGQVEWLMGNWKGQDPDGNTIQVSFSWAIKNWVVATHYKSREQESHAIVAVDPQSGEVKHTGYDGQGNRASGVWTAEEGGAILKLDYRTAFGDAMHVAYVMRQTSPNVMETTAYGMDSSGDISDEVMFEVKLERIQAVSEKKEK